MKFCSLHHWILFFIILIPVTDLTVTSLMAKLHQPATLTCNQKCSGVMTWKMSNNPVVLAFCDQTSCQSQEGFEISHDQYLNGNLTLVIRSVDYSKRTIFTCNCGDKAVCNVRLIIEPLVSQVHKKPGEDLVLDLHIQEPIEVDYKSKHTTDPYGELFCLMTSGSLRCGANYKQRASLSHTELTLRELKVSDSGVYIIRDIKNEEIIHTYMVFVEVPVTDLTVTSLTAKLHQPATLTCNQKCSGVMTWKMFHEPDVLAFCDQTSCSLEKGFEISYDQYLNGNLDLVIRSVDYSKRTIFTCNCGDKAVCNVRLNIEALVSQVQKKPGEDLVLDLHIPEVEVDYKSKYTTNQHSEWICNVTAGSLQCRTDYKQRASLSHTELTLRELKVSDSGVYIIRDMKNKEVIHKYLVSVEENPSGHWITVVGVVLVLVVILLLAVIFWFFWKNIYILKFHTELQKVNSLVNRYNRRENRMNSGEVEERLSKKIQEMDEFMNNFINAIPDLELLNNWWNGKRDEMNMIINECRAEMRANIEAGAEELIELNPR